MELLLTLVTLSCLFWTASSLSCRVCLHTELPDGAGSDWKRAWQDKAQSQGIWDPACKENGYRDTVECENVLDACMSASYAARMKSDGMTLDVNMYQRTCVNTEGSSVMDSKCEEISAYEDLIRGRLQNDDMLDSLEGQACTCFSQNCNDEELQTPEQQEGRAAFSGPVVHVMLLSLLIVLLFD